MDVMDGKGGIGREEFEEKGEMEGMRLEGRDGMGRKEGMG